MFCIDDQWSIIIRQGRKCNACHCHLCPINKGNGTHQTSYIAKTTSKKGIGSVIDTFLTLDPDQYQIIHTFPHLESHWFLSSLRLFYCTKRAPKSFSKEWLLYGGNKRKTLWLQNEREKVKMKCCLEGYFFRTRAIICETWQVKKECYN